MYLCFRTFRQGGQIDCRSKDKSVNRSFDGIINCRSLVYYFRFRQFITVQRPYFCIEMHKKSKILPVKRTGNVNNLCEILPLENIHCQ